MKPLILALFLATTIGCQTGSANDADVCPTDANTYLTGPDSHQDGAETDSCAGQTQIGVGTWTAVRHQDKPQGIDNVCVATLTYTYKAIVAEAATAIEAEACTLVVDYSVQVQQ